MNILQQEDIIKGLPDQALQEEAKAPSGQVPQFLVVSEIQRRTDMRKKYQDPNQQQPQGTVADQITQEGIASVQPQQPMQGQQQQGQPMPMRGGGMTPFMRKYAGGGVVRMQEGGITPNEMLQMDAQIMAQKYPFLSGSRDEILQGLSGIDPNDAGSISSMFGGAPEIDGVLQQVSNRNNLMSQDLSGGLGPAPMVENITPQSLLTLDGVNTLTPDGQRPYPPNTPSVDTLEQFSNAFREDAARAENLLATLDDSTAKEKEAISNPVNVNLPKIRTLTEIGEQAPQSLKGTGVRLASYQEREDAKYDPSSFGAMFDGSSREFPSRAKGVIGSNLSDLGSFLSDQFQDVKSSAGSSIDQGSTYLGSKEDESRVESLLATLGDLTPVKEFANSASGIGNVNPNNRGGFGRVLGDIRDSVVDSPFGNILSNSVGIDGSSSSEISGLDQARLEKTLALANRQQPMSQEDLQSETLKTFNSLVTNQDTSDNNLVGNQTTPTDGADNQGSGDIGVNNSNKAVNLLNNAFKLDLDASKKEAFAMAMIQLGAGIAKGDLAEGLSNAGVAASGVLEKSRDRAGKQMDREIQQKYFDAKLDDARQATNFRMQQAVDKALTEWQVANIGATPEEVETKRQELSRQYQVLGDTTATGSNIGGGNQRGVVGSYSQKTGLTRT